MTIRIAERVAGCLKGIAAGDAIGKQTESRPALLSQSSADDRAVGAGARDNHAIRSRRDPARRKRRRRQRFGWLDCRRDSRMTGVAEALARAFRDRLQSPARSAMMTRHSSL